MVLAAGCGEERVSPRDPCAPLGEPPAQPTVQCALDEDRILEGGGDGEVRLGLYLTVPQDGAPPRRPWSRADAEAVARAALSHTASIYAQCAVGLQLVAAEVIAVPLALQTVEGNHDDSWGGLAPARVRDADTFNYLRGERLAPEPRALFALRSALPDGALAVFVVDDITYHAAKVATRAGGLSFSPVVFHHPDDFPARNAILAAAAYAGLGEIPAQINGRTIAHELGHMLLNTGSHVSAENGGDPNNLMLEGEELVPAQCEIIRRNASWLYGEQPVVDPRSP